MFLLEDGSSVNFWEDSGCGESPLCDIFPTLFLLAETKGVKVAEVWDNTRGFGVWSPRFNKPFNDQEIGEVGEELFSWRRIGFFGKGIQMAAI